MVEVVLSLGITSTALLVIFSLMPLGMASLQDSQRQIVETEIYNKIGSELATTALYQEASRSTNLLKAYCGTGGTGGGRFPAYFDVEGNEISATAPRARAVFIVRCKDGVPSQNSWAVTSPNGELLYGTVKIGFHLDPDNAPAASTAVRQRTFLLSNHGSQL